MIEFKYRENRVLNGSKAGKAFVMRGDYVRMKIWATLIEADEPQQTTELMTATGFSYAQVKSWLDAWVKNGYLDCDKSGKSEKSGKHFLFMPPNPSTPLPAINLKGQEKKFSCQQLIWEAIRCFDSEGIMFSSSHIRGYIKRTHSIVARQDWIDQYLEQLYDVCYIDYKEQRDPGFTLTYNTGAYAPSIIKGSRYNKVFDPNLGVLVN